MARLLLVLLLLLAGCRHVEPNRALPQKSPSGRYVFDFSGGVPELRAGGRVVLRAAAAPFRKNPHLYWLWDDADRLWIYDETSKRVYYYQRGAHGWRRRYWSGKRSAHPERDLLPPLGLYPPCPSGNRGGGR